MELRTEWLTTQEVAAALGVHPQTIRAWRMKGFHKELTSSADRVTGRWFYPRSKVEQFRAGGKYSRKDAS